MFRVCVCVYTVPGVVNYIRPWARAFLSRHCKKVDAENRSFNKELIDTYVFIVPTYRNAVRVLHLQLDFCCRTFVLKDYSVVKI